MVEREDLCADLADARTRLLELLDGLPEDPQEVPRLPIVNPPLWEAGHVAWFQERWTLRHLGGCPPLLADALFDSAAVAHDARWELPLPPMEELRGVMARVLERVLERLRGVELDEREAYFARLVALHELMHGEALLYTRRTLGLPAPRGRATEPAGGGPCPGDVEVPGGAFVLGAPPGLPFAFDNELEAHVVTLAPFRIARAPVTQAEFRVFVEEGGYDRDAWWSAEGRRWRDAAGARHPLAWRRGGDGAWMRLRFDRLVPLEDHKPVQPVCWYEAEAFCRFVGRRLPTEAEWERAAAAEGAEGTAGADKALFPWGDAAPGAGRAHLDLAACDCCDVGAYPDGDSAAGCRQMLGNIWEWTASTFLPYPGFSPGPYREYSEPWFGTHKVLRGGSFATPARLLRASFRNFYTPDRRDVIAGFRTCSC